MKTGNITPYKIFIKWPRIMWRKFWFSAVHGPLRNIYFGKDGFRVLRDAYGIRFRYYSWDRSTFNKLIPRENYRQEFSAIKNLINPGDIVFDVGANMGIHSVYMSRLAGNNGKVRAFEPVLRTFQELKATIHLNKCKNVITENIALSNEQGTKTMQIFDRHLHEWNTFGKPDFGGIKPIETCDVKVDTLDNYCMTNNISRIDFLKIDVEGFEKHVLTGSSDMLKNKKINFISFEISQIPLRGAGISSDEVIRLLNSYGYCVYRYDSKTRSFFGPVSKSDDFHTNLYASWKKI